jgi:hypothetical protein
MKTVRKVVKPFQAALASRRAYFRGRLRVATITLLCGTLLIALGAVGFGLQDPEKRSYTALIPAALGVLFIITGLLARKDHLRKHAMHLAAALGLVGFLASLSRLLPKAFSGELTLSLATNCLLLMAIICASFVGLCVNSFIQARRARERGESKKV